MAIELLTPFTKVELEPEIKDKKRKQVGILKEGDLDQFASVQCLANTGFDLIIEPVFPNLDNGFDAVGLAIEESPLFGC